MLSYTCLQNVGYVFMFVIFDGLYIWDFLQIEGINQSLSSWVQHLIRLDPSNNLIYLCHYVISNAGYLFSLDFIVLFFCTIYLLIQMFFNEMIDAINKKKIQYCSNGLLLLSILEKTPNQ